MSTRLLTRAICLFCAAGVLFLFTPVTDCYAQKKTNAQKAAEEAARQQKKAEEEAAKKLEAMRKKALEQHKKAVEHARKMIKEEFKGKESEALKEAYVLMAAANHDYDGHRVKAMKQVEHAFDRLDANILKNGSLQQKIKTLQEENATAKARILEKNNAALHEVQALSDAQMFKAAAIVSVITEAAFFNDQPVVLGHLKKALVEMEIALMIR